MKKSTPYNGYPSSSFWKDSIVNILPCDIDPIISFGLKVNKATKIATAGSCFAQHIARNLSANEYNYFVTETPHPLLSKDLAAAYNYGTFTARYGNVYTSRQLLQLIQRVYGEFIPSEKVWRERGNCWIDPYRPNIQPNGFISLKEFQADRLQHFQAVRRAFEELDVFIFTLGLTECWINKEDGAVFPLCPGVCGGEFNENQHAFVNLSVEDVASDMLLFLTKLRQLNPSSKVILTVSPVPLIATAEPRHVLEATVYSKSVLRVAAEMICQRSNDVFYFPSYEIITGSFSKAIYFESDLRNITNAGVEHVMKLFFKHLASESNSFDTNCNDNSTDRDDKLTIEIVQNIVDVICDEELINRNLEK